MKKKMVILLISFAAVCLLAVIGGAVFRVKNVSVKFEYQTESVDGATVINDIKKEIESAFVGQSIFTASDSAMEQVVNKNNIRVSCVKVEVFFPNVVEIIIKERYEMYYLLDSGTQKYYILDKDMLLLEIIDGVSSFNSKPLAAELVPITNYGTINFAEAEVGKQLLLSEDKLAAFAEVEKFYKAVPLREDAMRERNRAVKFENAAGINAMYITTNQNIEIKIVDYLNSCYEKLALAVDAIESHADDAANSGKIIDRVVVDINNVTNKLQAVPYYKS